MRPETFLEFEKTPYPSGVFSNSGENLRVLARDESSYMPPVRPEATLKKCPIIVPTHRDVSKSRKNIENIMQLANGPVVFLCSGKAKIEAIAELASRYPTLTWMAVEGPYPYEGYEQNFETTYTSIAYGSEKDTPQKRNIGLLLARLMGWDTVFFLDDDVAITREQLYKAIDLLHHGNAAIAGFSARSYPDSSVAVHARRLASGSIDSFIGTGAMAVRTDRRILSFFPHIYNEDWLFLLVYCLFGDQDVVWAGTIKQRYFNPFRNPLRAQIEEPGDILGESLVRLAMSIRNDLKDESSFETAMQKLVKLANKQFWESEINDRVSFIQETREKLYRKPLQRYRRQALKALDSSLERLLGSDGQSGIRAEEFFQWMQAWIHDLEQWNKRDLPTGKYRSLPEALKGLGFTNKYLYGNADKVDNSLVPSLPSLDTRRQEVNVDSNPIRLEAISSSSPAILKKLENTQIVDEYLTQKGYNIGRIVKSASNLRFDRPIVTLQDNKPNLTVSMIVTPGESIEQICMSLKDIIRKGRVTTTMQFVLWVYGSGQYSLDELDMYRNRVVAHVVSEMARTNIFVRSSIIMRNDQNIDHLINDCLSELAFAYWKCKILTDHPVFVVNSRNELLRHGTLWAFIRGEHKVPRKTVAAYLRLLPKVEKQALILSEGDEDEVLTIARRRLAQSWSKYAVIPKDASRCAHDLTKHMHRSQLTWLQTDELAFRFRFHHKDNEDSTLDIKKRLCVLLEYADDLPSDKHILAREIIKVIQDGTSNLRSCTVVVRAQADVSYGHVERYRRQLVQAIKAQKPAEEIVLTSLTYHCAPEESDALSRKRIFTVIEYMLWLQNSTQRLPIMWCSPGSYRFRIWR
jgi:hypothetical protein